MENQTPSENIQEKSYDWIVSAIGSSNNHFHIECCKKLVELYIAKFPDGVKEAELLMLIYDRSNRINYM